MGFLPASRPSDTSTREASRQYAAQNRVVQWHEPEVYAPGEMGFTSAPGRDERWMQLPASVRERLWQYAGQEALLWWAFSSGEQRPKAVLFGNQALCFADPRVNTEHKPVYAVSVYHLTLPHCAGPRWSTGRAAQSSRTKEGRPFDTGDSGRSARCSSQECLDPAPGPGGARSPAAACPGTPAVPVHLRAEDSAPGPLLLRKGRR